MVLLLYAEGKIDGLNIAIREIDTYLRPNRYKSLKEDNKYLKAFSKLTPDEVKQLNNIIEDKD
jgi:hypothetical protein